MPEVTRLILVIVALCFLYGGYKTVRNIQSWKFLFQGRKIIQEAAKRAGDAPFSLPIFGYGGRMHVVSTSQHWADLKNAHVGHLSMHRWVKHMFQPKYSLDDEWKDRRDEDGMPQLRALRTMSNQLEKLRPKLVEMFQQTLDDKIQCGRKREGFTEMSLSATVEQLMVRSNTLFILGESAANDPILIRRGIAYTKEVAIIGETARLVPGFLMPLVARLVKGQGQNRNYVCGTMSWLVNKRRELIRESPKDSVPEPTTVLEAFVDYSPEHRSTREIVHHFNIMWTTTTLSIGVVTTQFIRDLLTHSSYHASLTQFMQTTPMQQSEKSHPSLLESLLLESMRTNSFQATSIHRTALHPFTFSDGYTIPAGEAVHFYLEGILSDSSRYPNPKVFDPWRWAAQGRRVTDVGMEWPFWGVGKNACPGRFFFNFAAKVLAEVLLMEYEAEVKGRTANIEWGETTLVDPRAVLCLRMRGGGKM